MSTLNTQIEAIEKQLQQLKATANKGSDVKVAFAEIKADKEKRLSKAAVGFTKFAEEKQAAKVKPLLDAGYVKISTAPNGAVTFGKKGSSYIIIDGDSFIVKSGIAATAEVIKSKAPLSQLPDFLLKK